MPEIPANINFLDLVDTPVELKDMPAVKIVEEHLLKNAEDRKSVSKSFGTFINTTLQAEDI